LTNFIEFRKHSGMVITKFKFIASQAKVINIVYIEILDPNCLNEMLI